MYTDALRLALNAIKARFELKQFAKKHIWILFIDGRSLSTPQFLTIDYVKAIIIYKSP